MEIALLFVSFALCYFGLSKLNHNGSYTPDKRDRVIGYTSHLVALFCAMTVYGNLRGLFVYLGIVALVGMVLVLLHALFSTES